MAGGAVPRRVVPSGRRLARRRGRRVRRGRPVRQRVPGGGTPGPDVPAAAGVLDPDRGAGADVRAIVRGGPRPAPLSHDPCRALPVGSAAGAAGPAGTVVPLPPPVP